MSSPTVARRPRGGPVVDGVGLVVGSVLAWVVWMAWDTSYDRDPVTGQVSGPYEAWQVVGCVLTLVAVVAVAGARGRPSLALALVPVVFTAAWSVSASASDTSGLWAVGATLVLVGTLAGTAAVGFGAQAVRPLARGGPAPGPRT